jgi:hypothetical protein
MHKAEEELAVLTHVRALDGENVWIHVPSILSQQADSSKESEYHSTEGDEQSPLRVGGNVFDLNQQA